MKILLVNHLLDPVSGGGTAERTLQMARFLATEGAECTLLTLDIGGIGAGARPSLFSGVNVVAVPCLNQRFFLPYLCYAKLKALVEDADVVYLSGHWTLLNAWVFHVCKRLGKPYLFCPAGALKPFGRSRVLKWLYAKLVGGSLARSAAACVAVTEGEKSDFAECGVPAERVVVVPNGIDPAEYVLANPTEEVASFRRKLGLDASRFILFLGRLNPIKGPDLLLEAFSRLPPSVRDVHLVLAGPDGGMRGLLEQSVAALGLDGRVHFAGYVGGSEKVAALHAATVLAIPSRREAMSIVVLEGGICACPVVFTDTCGLDAIARDNAGVMVSVSVAALSGALENLLASPEELRRSGEQLQRIIRQHYLWQSQARRLLALAEHVASNPGQVKNG